MSTNLDFQQAAEQQRMQAFYDANRATECSRCGNDFGVIDKRGLCFSCSEKRLASLAADALPNQNVGVPRNETAAECNERLRKAKAARDAIKPAVTIKSLLGTGGFPLVSGMDLCRANSALSGRVSIMEIIKKLGPIETFLISNSGNSEAWSNYQRRFEQISRLCKDVAIHEAKLRESFPDLVVEPIMVPEQLVRGEPRACTDWMEV